MNRDNIQDNKRELQEYIYNKKWIKDRLNDIVERRSLLEKVTSTISDMPRSNSIITDKMADGLAKILDDTNDLEKYIKDLKERQYKIEDKIDKIEQPYRNILYYRYIQGLNLTEVSGEIEEEYDYTRKLHGIALIKYSEIK